MMRLLFVATKNFQSPQGRAIQKISIIVMFTIENSLVTTKGTNQIPSIAHPCGD
jgi:hypothetical protein